MTMTSHSETDATERNDGTSEALLDAAMLLATADTLPEDWPVLVSRLVVQLLASTVIGVESGTLEVNGAKVRETLATALFRVLPDGIRTELPVDDQHARILAHYTPVEEP